jgi:proton-coupled amino acid transporter
MNADDDPLLEKEERPTEYEPSLSSPATCYVNCLKSIVGSGVIALPFAIKKTGWTLGILSLLFVAMLSDYTMRQLVYTNRMFRQRHPMMESMSIRDVAREALGGFGIVITDIALTLCQFGAGCSFLAFISENLADVFASGDDKAHERARQTILAVTSVLVLVLSLLKTTTYLAPTAYVGNFCFVVGIIGVWYIGFSDHPPSFKNTVAVDWSGIPSFFGIACFAFSAHPQVVVLEQAARDKPGYIKILDAAVISATIAFAAFGVLGYLFFGEKTESIIFLNLGHGAVATMVKIMMATMVVFNYPFTLVPLLENIEQMFKMRKTIGPGMLSIFVGPQRALMRTLVVLGTVVVADLVQDFGFLTAITGSLANGIIAFVLPPLFYVGIHSGRSSVNKNTEDNGEEEHKKGRPSSPSKAVLWANCALAMCGTAFSLGSAGVILAKKLG